jgi:hypothetical protein
MAYTAARVTQGGLPYRIVGTEKLTITDVTITSYTAGGEQITAGDLGLSSVNSAQGALQSVSGAGATAVEFPVTSGLKVQAVLATGADGAVGATNSVVRVTARGY